MVAILRHGASQEKIDHLIKWLKDKNLDVHISVGAYQTVLGLIGDTTQVDMDMLASLDIVESVARVSDTFKACNGNSIRTIR